MEHMLKSQENHLKSVMEKIEQHHVERLTLHASNFEYIEKIEKNKKFLHNLLIMKF